MKWNRTALSEWGCILSGAIAVGTFVVWLFGIKPSPGSLLPIIAVAAALACGSLFYLGKRLEQKQPTSRQSYVGSQRRVFVLSNGCALQLSRDAVGVLLQIFTSEAAKLTYTKVILLRYPEWKLEFDSAEPSPLGAMELAPKRVERDNLTEEQIQIIKSGVVINGYVRLEYGDEHEVVQFSLTNQSFI